MRWSQHQQGPEQKKIHILSFLRAAENPHFELSPSFSRSSAHLKLVPAHQQSFDLPDKVKPKWKSRSCILVPPGSIWANYPLTEHIKPNAELINSAQIIAGFKSQLRVGILIAQVPEKWLCVNTKVSPERPPEISKLPWPRGLRKFVFWFLANNNNFKKSI